MNVVAEQGGITPQQVSEDLMVNHWFDWVLFLQGRPFDVAVLQEGVTSLKLVVSAPTPAEPTQVVTTNV